MNDRKCSPENSYGNIVINKSAYFQRKPLKRRIKNYLITLS